MSIHHHGYVVVIVGTEDFENVVSEKRRNLRAVVVYGSENFDEDLFDKHEGQLLHSANKIYNSNNNKSLFPDNQHWLCLHNLGNSQFFSMEQGRIHGTKCT